MSDVLSKDQSIVAQVAAKIACDIVTKTGAASVDEAVADWASATQTIYSVLAEMHGWQQIDAPIPVDRAIANVQQAFPQAQVITETQAAQPQAALVVQQQPQQGGVRVAGKQHGPLPEWLITEAAMAGVTEVWDNRDKLAENSKRPHFKAVNGDKAFWPPRGR